MQPRVSGAAARVGCSRAFPARRARQGKMLAVEGSSRRSRARSEVTPTNEAEALRQKDRQYNTGWCLTTHRPATTVTSLRVHRTLRL